MVGAAGHAGAVVLSPVTADLRPGVLSLAPRQEQEVFSGRAGQTLPAADADPPRHPVTLLDDDGRPVGFFVLDTTHDLLLRAFFVDAAHQRRGHARRALEALPAYARRHFPAARSITLTVNVRNVEAYAAYIAGGFADGGELHLGGPAGPQHVLRLPLGDHDDEP